MAKLAPAEAKAVKFVLLIVALSAIARLGTRPNPVEIVRKPVVEAGAVAALGTGSEKAKQTRGPLDPNKATITELDRLPGVGDVTARKIIAARPLHSLDDLAKVVGVRKAKQLAPHLTLHGTLAPQRESPAREPSQPGRKANSSTTREQIDLNRATRAQLELVSGIGPALAGRLIIARDSLGGFRDWSQVDAVAGVGPALLKKLKEAARL